MKRRAILVMITAALGMSTAVALATPTVANADSTSASISAGAEYADCVENASFFGRWDPPEILAACAAYGVVNATVEEIVLQEFGRLGCWVCVALAPSEPEHLPDIGNAPLTAVGSGLVDTGGYRLTLRSGPSSSSSPIGIYYPDGTRLEVVCTEWGQIVDGMWGPSSLWDYVTDPWGDVGYVADGFVYTGVNGPLPGAPDCSATLLP